MGPEATNCEFSTRPRAESVFSLKGDDSPYEVRFTADSQRLVAWCGGDPYSVKFFDVTNGRLLSASATPFPKSWNSGVAGTPPVLDRQGKFLAGLDVPNQMVVLWNCAEGREAWRFPNVLVGAVNLVFNARQSFPGRRPQRAAETGRREIGVEDHQHPGLGPRCREAGVRPGTQRFLWLARPHSAGTARSWPWPDVGKASGCGTSASRQELPSSGRFEDCYGLHFTPDGRRLVSVYQSGKVLQMKIWDVATGRELFTLSDFAAEHPGSTYGGDVEFSADGRRIFTCGDGTLKVWDGEQGHLLLTLRPALCPLRLSADGRHVATAGPQGSTIIWSAGALP